MEENVERPAPGDTVQLATKPAQVYLIKFDPSEAQVLIEGADFALVFADGGRIVFENLVGLAEAGEAPILRVGDVDISGDVIVGQALALSGEQPTLDTAAGEGPSVRLDFSFAPFPQLRRARLGQ